MRRFQFKIALRSIFFLDNQLWKVTKDGKLVNKNGVWKFENGNIGQELTETKWEVSPEKESYIELLQVS